MALRLRKKSAREQHADLRGSADRDALAILAATDRTRVPELVAVRYQRMLESPFAFLRGAAAVMAEDLRHQPSVGIAVQACGDCHLMNFGAFATPEQNILFDINDFDETLPGVDFTVDLKRLAASVAVAALAAGASKKRARAMADNHGRSLPWAHQEPGRAFALRNLAKQDHAGRRNRSHCRSWAAARTQGHPCQSPRPPGGG
jgi:uncharacterized protein (DUF2252 family)